MILPFSDTIRVFLDIFPVFVTLDTISSDIIPERYLDHIWSTVYN